MSQIFASQLGLKIWNTNIGAWKIADTIFETYKMVISTFTMLNKDGRERFFEKSFSLADVKLDVMLGIFFFVMNNTDIDF